MIDTNDVDPIAEAEVYMAYGREAQAEEILKDAIAKEPKRYELHLKLLEMYAARKDTAAYETIAGELYTTLGAGDATWAKVAAMGASIEPDNPLYKTSSTVSSSVLGAVAHTTKLNVDDFSDIGEISSENANVEEMDFSLDADNAQVGEDFLAESSKEEPSEFEFDLGDFDLNNQDSSSNIDSSSASKFDKESVFNESKISEIDFNAIDTNAFGTELKLPILKLVSSVLLDSKLGRSKLISVTATSAVDSTVEAERLGRVWLKLFSSPALIVVDTSSISAMSKSIPVSTAGVWLLVETSSLSSVSKALVSIALKSI